MTHLSRLANPDPYPYRPIFLPQFDPLKRMDRHRLIAEDVLVIPSEVKSVRVASDTDAFAEKHVIIDFETHSMELDPSYTFEEIREALAGGCYYRSAYFDEVGDLPICVVHAEITEYEFTGGAGSQFRRCRKNDPVGDARRAQEKWDQAYEAAQERQAELWPETPEPIGFWRRFFNRLDGR